MFDWVGDALLWLQESAYQVSLKVFNGLLDSLAAGVETIPVPGFVSNIPALWTAVPDGVFWFIDIAMLPEGFAIIISAYVLRFVIRRLPFIG